jgi:hypothetical protein
VVEHAARKQAALEDNEAGRILEVAAVAHTEAVVRTVAVVDTAVVAVQHIEADKIGQDNHNLFLQMVEQEPQRFPTFPDKKLPDILKIIAYTQ